MFALIAFIRDHHDASGSWEKVRTRGLDIEAYKNDRDHRASEDSLKSLHGDRAILGLKVPGL
jgi:hypothetical protein